MQHSVIIMYEKTEEKNQRNQKLWTGLVGLCENRFLNKKSGLRLLNRLDHPHLGRGLRSALHYPAQSLLQHCSHAALQTQSERYLIIALVVQFPVV